LSQAAGSSLLDMGEALATAASARIAAWDFMMQEVRVKMACVKECKGWKPEIETMMELERMLILVEVKSFLYTEKSQEHNGTVSWQT
jgi:hypothetical protein